MPKLREQIDEVLATLTEREQRIIRLRIGLVDDGRSRTRREIGEEFNVTRERIRQIEARALRKLRLPSRSRELHGYQAKKELSEMMPEDKLLAAIFGETINKYSPTQRKKHD